MSVCLTACCSKVNKKARLVERKACFILDAGNLCMGRTDSCLKANSPSHWQSGDKNFYRQREGATRRNSRVSSDSDLEIHHWWSDQHHPDYFKSIIFSCRIGLFPFPWGQFSQIVAAYVMATISIYAVNSFHLVGVSVSIRQLIGYGSEYYLQPWRRN